MAVLTLYTDGYPDPTLGKNPRAVFAEGVFRTVKSTILVPSGASIGSKIYFGKVPYHALFLTQAKLWHEAIAGLTSLGIGFDTGGASAALALASGLDVSAAGSKSPVGAIATANLNKYAWQLAGYAQNPRNFIDLVGTLATATTGSGTLHLELPYLTLGN